MITLWTLYFARHKQSETDHERRTPFPVRVVYFPAAAHRAGIETQTIDGVTVRIYSPAKTVAHHLHGAQIDISCQ